MKKKAERPKKKTLEPQQERSRESLEKLLRAAIEVLGQHGIEGATIPRIAHHAGLTPGSVYRRFADKDALLETAILRLLERQDKSLRGMTPDLAREISLRAFAETTINNLIIGYRSRAPMLRAIRQFVRSRRGTPFSRKASRLEISTYQQLVGLFAAHADRIKHPDPRRAIATGLMMVISTVVELIVMGDDLSAWKDLLPIEDQALRRELVRAFLNYLGVEDAPGAAGKMEAEQVAAMNRWRERSSQNV
ncbi:MAG TPA: helix-turn-helix domain-containing protein [Candidatus Angelobacter sp.]|nr:helix-turn-helix domain-containing protein [Candidatus Angelobacter sp.]